MKKVIAVFLAYILATGTFPVPARAQFQQAPSTGNCVQVAGASLSCVYSPTQLGVNALTLPANPTNSALSTVIDTRGVKEAVLSWSCTAAAMTMSLNVQTYAEDGSTLQALMTPVSAVTSGTLASTTIGSESNPATSTGTLATAPAGVVRFPQRAIAFSFLDSGATTGTCTARLFVQY